MPRRKVATDVSHGNSPDSGKYHVEKSAPGGRVDITQEMIDQAERRNSGHCMIAEAVKAAFPRARRVSVDLQTIRFSYDDEGERYTFLTPRTAQVALVRFDQEIHTEPFSIRLRGGSVTETAQGRKAASKTRLVKSGDKSHPVPRRNGGKTPPTAAVGKARRFGLRSLDI